MGGVVSTAAMLLAELRERRIELRAVGDKLRYQPAEQVTPADRERLRSHKSELLALLTAAESQSATVVLDGTTVHAVLGPAPGLEAVQAVRREVATALAGLEAAIGTGKTPPRLLIRGHPLADWLSLDEVARLLRLWRRATANSAQPRTAGLPLRKDTQ